MSWGLDVKQVQLHDLLTYLSDVGDDGAEIKDLLLLLRVCTGRHCHLQDPTTRCAGHGWLKVGGARTVGGAGRGRRGGTEPGD